MNLRKSALVATLIATFVLIAFCVPEKKSFDKVALSEKLLAPDGSQQTFESILKKHKGQTLLIEVWASWCGDCVKAMPKVKELQINNSTVSYLFISMDKTPDKWKDGIKKHELQGDHYMALDQMKGVFGKAIDLDWIPRYIIVDKKGNIVLYRAIETDFEKIERTLKSLK